MDAEPRALTPIPCGVAAARKFLAQEFSKAFTFIGFVWSNWMCQFEQTIDGRRT